MATSRTDFNNTWLTEMPSGVSPISLYDSICRSIFDRIKYGGKVIQLENNLNKIEGVHVIHYWYGDNTEIILGVELDVKPQGLVVTMIGKNPKYKNQPPYASDLYNAILNDKHKSIRLFSDTQLSDEGLSIWKKLVSLGHTVSIYDRANPGQSFKTFDSPDELNQFFTHNNSDYKRYQYVLSESGELLSETRSFFNTRRMRELAGYSLED